jgi:hypothetical protein
MDQLDCLLSVLNSTGFIAAEDIKFDADGVATYATKISSSDGVRDSAVEEHLEGLG